jgi:hypothetical protein
VTRTLEQEQAAFDAQLDALLPKHEGEFVLFKDGSVVLFFSQYDEAYRAGIERFGPDEVFLVGQVRRAVPVQVSVAWCAGVMFG